LNSIYKAFYGDVNSFLYEIFPSFPRVKVFLLPYTLELI
jgi:hypothetical protein